MYGYCPKCGAEIISRTRGGPNAMDTCVNHHRFPSREALQQRPTDIASGPTTLAQALSTPTEPMKGPLAIAVASQTEADALRELLGISKGPNDQGFVVIPFGGSILSFAPGGTLLLRGLVVIPPHGGPISRQAFDGWVASAINPYLAPQAPRLIL